jgi:hypothetical protein
VPLILAINPGNSHSPTLARLARELQGFELIGAESCAVAITAINERRPDLVLMPDRTPRGEADLFARLKAVPGGVPTLKLPPVSSADPSALAKEIRALTAAPKAAAPAPKPKGPSPHLIAAAKAAIVWIHLRQAQWADMDAEIPAFASPAADSGAHEPGEAGSAFAPDPDRFGAAGSSEPSEPHEPDEPHGRYERDMFGGESDEPSALRSAAATWLPRVAAVLALIAIAATGFWLYPRIRGSAPNTGSQLDTPSAPARVETTPPPSPSEPPPGDPAVAAPVATAAPDPAEKVSGFVAVFAPFDISVTNANEAVPLDDRSRAMLPPGKYRLRFQNAAVGYDETRTVQVRSTETTTINLIPQTSISVTSNEPAEVLIDGTPAGETPFEGRLPFGAHTVIVRTPGGERQFPLEATMKPVQLEVDFSKP